ncbi:MAG TPA: hypothetical protein VLE47_03945 [Candidatus Saccharimonadales bacterium]|nr:hypothetical protein [Candidatus Saccharimonadales bacterium]
MDEQEKQHEELLEKLSSEYHEIIDHSDQAVYIYLDDRHKLCNENFAKMLGYSSPEEWAKLEPFTDSLVADESKKTLVSTYQNAMQNLVGAEVEITWKKKDSGSVKTRVILVPIAFGGELLALHFISLAD